MATLTSVKDGDFRDPTTWSPATVPGISDVLYIYHKITMTGTNRFGTGTSGSSMWYQGGSIVPDKTQVISNNDFSLDDDLDGLANNFSLTGTYTGTPTTSIVSGYVKSTSQRIQYTGTASDSGSTLYLTSDYSSAIFKYTASGVVDKARITFLYNTGSSSGVDFEVFLSWYDGSNNLIGTTTASSLLNTDGKWFEFVHYADCPSGAVKLKVNIGAKNIDNNDVADLRVDWIRGYNISYTQFNTNWAPASGSVQTADVSEHPDQQIIFEVRSGNLYFKPESSASTIINFKGYSKEHSKKIVQANAGTNYIIVENLGTDWKVGDYISIESGHNIGSYSNQNEFVKQITAICPETNTIYINTNLSYTHIAGSYVYNYSRNFVFRTLSGYTSNMNFTNMTSGAIYFEGCEFNNFGNMPDAGGYGIYISGAGCKLTFKNCVFQSLAQYGLRPINYGTIDVDNCLFFNNNYAISLQGSANNCRIGNSYFIKNTGGIISGYSAGGITADISNCYFIDNATAINWQSSTNLISTDLRFCNNSTDIAISGGTNNGFYFKNCIFGENRSSSLMPSTYNINFSSASCSNGKFINNIYKANGQYVVANTHNLLSGSNVSFDDNSGSYTYVASGLIAKETSVVRSGTTALKLSGRGAANNAYYKANAIAKAGLPISISGYIKMSSDYGNELTGGYGDFETDSNSDGQADNTGYYRSGTSNPVLTMSSDSYTGSYSQKVQWTGVPGEASTYKMFYVITNQTVSPGDIIYYEFYVKGTTTGTMTIQPVGVALNASKNYLASTYGTSFIMPNSWVKVSGVYTIPANGAYFGFGIGITSFDNGDSATFYMDNAVCYKIAVNNVSSGGRPSLPVITLSGAGIETQTWSMPAVYNEWVQFTLSGTPTKTTLVDLTVAIKDNNGSVYLDDVVVAGVDIDTGTFDYYYEGYPINILFATPVSSLAIASAVWEEQVSSHTNESTMGEVMGSIPTAENIRQEMDTNSQIARDAKQAKLNTY